MPHTRKLQRNSYPPSAAPESCSIHPCPATHPVNQQEINDQIACSQMVKVPSPFLPQPLSEILYHLPEGEAGSLVHVAYMVNRQDKDADKISTDHFWASAVHRLKSTTGRQRKLMIDLSLRLIQAVPRKPDKKCGDRLRVRAGERGVLVKHVHRRRVRAQVAHLARLPHLPEFT